MNKTQTAEGAEGSRGLRTLFPPRWALSRALRLLLSERHLFSPTLLHSRPWSRLGRVQVTKVYIKGNGDPKD